MPDFFPSNRLVVVSFADPRHAVNHAVGAEHSFQFLQAGPQQTTSWTPEFIWMIHAGVDNDKPNT